MKEKLPENVFKCTMELKSYTYKNRIKEAACGLLAVYPFQVKEDHILVLKSHKKGFYDVCITVEKINQKKDLRKLIIAFLCILLASIMIFLFLHNVSLNNRKIQNSRIARERQKETEFIILKEKEKKLEKLIKEYEIKKDASYERIYPYLERLYSVMTVGTTVENLSIEKNMFLIEVTTKDALQILKAYEESSGFKSVKMNRTTLKDGMESVAYSGEFSRNKEYARLEDSIDEKIEFYSKEIDKINKRIEISHEKQVSEYIKDIRNILRKNSCMEQYIQIKEKEKIADVEFFILSSGKGILSFLKEIQEGENSFIDIKSFRLRNSEEKNRIQSIISFDSGIDLKKENLQIENYELGITELSDMEKIFNKETAFKTMPVENKFPSVNPINKKTDSFRYLKTLSFIGITKSNGNTLVMAKDEEMNTIYKLVLKEEESIEDCCVASGSGYMAKIRGDYYEVKK